MKRNKGYTRFGSIVLILSILLLSLSLVSCSPFSFGLISLGDGTPSETSGQTVNTTPGGSLANPSGGGAGSSNSSGSGNSSGSSGGTNVTIIGDGTDNVAVAVAQGLCSAVSIYCTFEKTVLGGSFWNPQPTTQTYYTTGSGVLYTLDADGSAFILTNHHVVYDAGSTTANGVSDTIYVYLYGMENEAYAIPATFVGGSANYDIAVLRVEKSAVLKNAYASGSAAAVSIGDSDMVFPGMTTIAIGNPSATDLGGLSVTKGIVSVDSEYITMVASDNSGEVSFRVIRTDTPVNSGNSGGGLYSDKGELIGIVNAKITSSEIESIGYAIPSNVARAIADNIIDYCYQKDCESVMRGLLGVTITTTAYSTVYDTESGMLVRSEEISVHEVTAGGLAENILKAGDVVKSITIGERTVTVSRQHHLIDAMLDVRIGDKVSMVIVRGGTEMTVTTTITEDCLAAY